MASLDRVGPCGRTFNHVVPCGSKMLKKHASAGRCVAILAACHLSHSRHKSATWPKVILTSHLACLSGCPPTCHAALTHSPLVKSPLCPASLTATPNAQPNITSNAQLLPQHLASHPPTCHFAHAHAECPPNTATSSPIASPPFWPTSRPPPSPNLTFTSTWPNPSPPTFSAVFHVPPCPTLTHSA